MFLKENSLLLLESNTLFYRSSASGKSTILKSILNETNCLDG